jgi:hypothetical protein
VLELRDQIQFLYDRLAHPGYDAFVSAVPTPRAYQMYTDPILTIFSLGWPSFSAHMRYVDRKGI